MACCLAARLFVQLCFSNPGTGSSYGDQAVRDARNCVRPAHGVRLCRTEVAEGVEPTQENEAVLLHHVVNSLIPRPARALHQNSFGRSLVPA